MSERYGGHAFPLLDNSGSGLSLREPGMTLRDYFAGQALTGLLAGESTETPFSSRYDAAHRAFDIADAMLEVRAK